MDGRCLLLCAHSRDVASAVPNCTDSLVLHTGWLGHTARALDGRWPLTTAWMSSCSRHALQQWRTSAREPRPARHLIAWSVVTLGQHALTLHAHGAGSGGAAQLWRSAGDGSTALASAC